MRPIKQLFLLTALALTSTFQSCMEEENTVIYQPAVGTVDNQDGKLLLTRTITVFWNP